MLQNALVLSLIVGFAVMEFASRRYQTTVRATANDTKLELLMLLSLVAVAQPVALLGADRISSWLMPGQRNAWALLAQVAPEMSEWAAFFSAGAGKRAAAEAGLSRLISARDADDLVRDVERYLMLVQRALDLPYQSSLPATGPADVA